MESSGRRRMYRRFRLLSFFLIAAGCGAGARAGVDASLGTASVTHQEERLVVSTGEVRREWTWTGSGLKTTSYRSLSDEREWATAASDYQCDFGLPNRITNQSSGELVSVDCIESDDEGFASPHLLVTAVVKYRCG